MCGGAESRHSNRETSESKEPLLSVYSRHVNYLFYKKDEGSVILFLISYTFVNNKQNFDSKGLTQAMEVKMTNAQRRKIWLSVNGVLENYIL